MRILYFSPRECWPLNTGARLRDYHFARQLARQARVTYLGLRSPSDPAPIDPPPESGFERSILLETKEGYAPLDLVRGLVGPLPVTVLKRWSNGIASRLGELVNGPEAFHSTQIEGMHLVQYVPVLRDACRRSAIVADWHNIESEIMWRYSETSQGTAKKLYARRTARLIENMELRLLRSCDVHVVPSARERNILLARVADARIEVVGNGVDVAHHSDEQLAAACVQAGVAFPETQRDVLFVGSMDYHANIEAVLEFAEDTWPGIAARHPDFRFVVAGRRPPAAITALSAKPGIMITGTVDDVRTWYCSAFVVVVPLRTGSGTRLKILEAMAAGVPVISTRLGAEGLDVTDGLNVILAETSQEMRDAVDALFNSPEKWRALADAGRRLVQDQYDWASLGERLFRIHNSVTGKE